MVAKALVKHIFDKSKIEVVGSPTITDDGIASGFSATNYIKTLSTLDISSSATNNIAIKLDFETAQDVTTNQYILHSVSYAQFSLFVRDGVLKSSLGDGSNWTYNFTNIINIESNSKYSIEIEISKTIVEYKIFKNKIYLNTLTYDGTLLQNNHDMRFVIGVTLSFNTPFLGSIDLKQFSTKANNNLNYSPTRPITYLERKKKGFDKSKFTVINSPNITTGGVVNKFSYTSYVSIPNSIVSKIETTSWKISFMGISPSSNTTLNITGVSATSKGKLNIGWINNTSNFFLQLKNSTVEKAVYVRTNNPNTPFIGYAEFDGTDNYTIAISFDGGVTFSKNTMTAGERVNFERADLPIATGSDSATGSIDLKSILVESGNKEIFNGQIEKYYALQV
jgi:hypothetical protein